MKNLLFLYISLFLTLACNGQSFKYRSLPKSLNFQKSSSLNILSSLKSTVNNNVCYLDDVLDQSQLNNINTLTKTLQDVFLKYPTVVMPNYPIKVSENGLNIPNNFTLVFQPNSALRISPNNKERYEILRIHNVSNVKIISPTIIGDRKKHYGRAGEWGMGIAIRSSQNVIVENANISECWGDGIYVGEISNGGSSKNIQILNSLIDNNRRNGISVTSVDGIKIQNVMVSNTNGTLPMSGIDIEPGNENEIIKNVNISNVHTFNNVKGGIVVNLNKLSMLNSQSGDVSIDVNGHVDDYSGTGFYISGIKDRSKSRQIKGRISVQNSKLNNNSTSVNFGNNMDLLPEVTLSKIQVLKKNSLGLNKLKERAKTHKNILIKD